MQKRYISYLGLILVLVTNCQSPEPEKRASRTDRKSSKNGSGDSSGKDNSSGTSTGTSNGSGSSNTSPNTNTTNSGTNNTQDKKNDNSSNSNTQTGSVKAQLTSFCDLLSSTGEKFSIHHKHFCETNLERTIEMAESPYDGKGEAEVLEPDTSKDFAMFAVVLEQNYCVVRSKAYVETMLKSNSSFGDTKMNIKMGEKKSASDRGDKHEGYFTVTLSGSFAIGPISIPVNSDLEINGYKIDEDISFAASHSVNPEMIDNRVVSVYIDRGDNTTLLLTGMEIIVMNDLIKNFMGDKKDEMLQNQPKNIYDDAKSYKGKADSECQSSSYADLSSSNRAAP